ncbi:MAG: ECF transporter S component, partial [Candidatus Cloacimonadaceae bacterium]|nr:ECF transporter S component [Candidatus Cloacimonadaceae bacterium]
MKWYYLVGLTIVVMVATLLIRIPLPGKGYFNFGDAVVVFAGLYGGKKVGLIAGGIGSAMADLIGFPIFVPITLVAKGLEGWLCGCAHQKQGVQFWVFPICGVFAMVLVYFYGGILMPQIGLAGAVSEFP